MLIDKLVCLTVENITVPVEVCDSLSDIMVMFASVEHASLFKQNMKYISKTFYNVRMFGLNLLNCLFRALNKQEEAPIYFFCYFKNLRTLSGGIYY